MNIIFTTVKYSVSKFNILNYEQDIDWENYLKSIGFQNVLIQNLKKELFYKLNPKAVIITGGGDIYKVKKDYINRVRDYKEKKIIKFCLINKIPIIAICRGFQLIAAEIYKKKLFKIKNHIKKSHQILNKNQKIYVNSFHNYEVRDLPKNFKKIYYCKKGGIELAMSQKPKILLLMFHPERKNKSQNKVNKIIKNFINK